MQYINPMIHFAFICSTLIPIASLPTCPIVMKFQSRAVRKNRLKCRPVPFKLVLNKTWLSYSSCFKTKSPRTYMGRQI